MLTLNKVETVLGREEIDFTELTDKALESLRHKEILVTGAAGSLGTALMDRFKEAGFKDVLGLDIVASKNHPLYHVDVCKKEHLYRFMEGNYYPDIIFHFAADKHAPQGEEDPRTTFNINIKGTQNIIDAFPLSKIVLSSTCKACNPETVYGATKLIAERLVLNEDGVVARFYNVVESAENVFEIWDKTPKEDHFVTACYRYFISLNEAVALTLFSAVSESGRYSIDVGNARYMPEVYHDLFSTKTTVKDPRRGDRVLELLKSSDEEIKRLEGVNGIVSVVNYHDA